MQPFPSAGVDVFVRSRRPWGKVAADFFVHKGHSYLFVVDYYSRDIEICLVQLTPDNSNLQGKSKKGSSYLEFEENSRE